MNPAAQQDTLDSDGGWTYLRDEALAQLNQVRQEIKEVDMMLEQSQLEVNRLSQRNAQTTGALQRIQMNFDSVPREDIRLAYEAALDSQQRLFVMRGHLEKMQSDRAHLQQEINLLEQSVSLIEAASSTPSKPKKSTASVESLEMIIQAQEAERQRLSRQMHDGPAQALSNLILQAEIAMRLFETDREKAYEELNSLKESVTAAFQQVRDFIFELRPMMLDDLGLVPTLKKYSSALKEKSGIDIRLNMTGEERRLEPYLEVMVFRAIQELLSNAIFHSQASEVRLKVDQLPEELRISIEDNGRGIDTDNLEKDSGMGLKVIKERAEMLGGSFVITSRLGEGTRVEMQVPAGVLGHNE